MHKALQPLPTGRKTQRGFTLVELMIALVVMAILAAVALPSFLDSMRKSRRSEAFAAMAAIQQAQERWRSGRATYAGSLGDLGMSSPTSSGYYQLATSAGAGASAPTAYTVTAEGIGGTQVNDAQCKKLSIQVDRGSVKYAGCGSCSTFSYSTQDPCWKQ